MSVEKSIHLKNMLDKNIKSVGVFLNNTYDEILNICIKNIIDIIQIHGNISNEFIDKLKSDLKAAKIKIKGRYPIRQVTGHRTRRATSQLTRLQIV